MELNNLKTASYYIKQLELLNHPEGGYFKEIYRDLELCAPLNFPGSRNYSTAIYYLLEKGDFSCFHRIKSDEVWHHYDGGCTHIYYLKNEELITLKLGKNMEEGESMVCVVPKNTWFAAELAPDCEYALMGCTVAPGFDFNDFEMATQTDLPPIKPSDEKLVKRLIKTF